MKTLRIPLALVLVVAVVAVTFVLTRPRSQSPGSESHSSVTTASTVAPPEPPSLEAVSEGEPLAATNEPASQPAFAEAPVEETAQTINKLDRLAQIRETFRALAAGDKMNALQMAKEIVDGNEREVALMTLVTEWTQGELGPPQLRAERIARVGLEAGLGMELGRNPELALLWADELTKGDGRDNVLQVTARFLVNSDPAAAFALAQRLPEANRRGFSDALFANWASHDTDAALRWAEQFSDPTERDAAVQAIRTSAPVGIGAALRIQDGFPVINGLVPGTPAERSGQLHVGDRIVALARGDNLFVDLRDLPLQEVVQEIRGAPNTLVQLKVLSANAPPNSVPRTVSILRDQIKFKN